MCKFKKSTLMPSKQAGLWNAEERAWHDEDTFNFIMKGRGGVTYSPVGIDWEHGTASVYMASKQLCISKLCNGAYVVSSYNYKGNTCKPYKREIWEVA